MRNIAKKIIAVGLAATMAVGALAGCGGGSSSNETGGSGAGSDLTTLTFGCANYSGGGIDPACEINTAWNSMRYGITEALVKFDDAMEVHGWLADELDVNDEHTVWTLHIRDGVLFSDGCACDADAVVASLNYTITEGNSEGNSSGPNTYIPEGSEIVADAAANTVTITTPAPVANLWGSLCYPVMVIVDAEHMPTRDDANYNHGTIGTGPYVVDTFTEEVGYTMTANQNYWGGEVPFETVEILYMGDASAKAMALQNGQIMLTENITSTTDLENLINDPNFNVSITNGVRTAECEINMNRVLANDALRHAIIKAIDGETLCEVTLGGLYTYGYSVLPSNLAYNYDQLTFPDAFDPDQAMADLDAAGIVDSDNDGWRELDGQKITLEFLTYENRGLNTFAEGVQQQLAEIGIDVHVNCVDSETLHNLTTSGDFDIANSNWTTVGTGDPFDYLSQWETGNTNNDGGFSNAEYDALYGELRNCVDPARRTEIITQLQQILLDTAGAYAHGYYNSCMISSTALTGADIHTADYYWLSTDIRPAG